MIAPACKHEHVKKCGKDRLGNQRYRCKDCGLTWIQPKAKPLGKMTVDVETAKLALRLLCEGSSIRSTERITGLHRDTICRLLVTFGERCREFLDKRMRGLKLTHL